MQTALACGLLAVLVLFQFSPMLACRADCVPDLPSIHGAKLGAFEMVDVRLNVWILAWVQRALALDPLHLFDANAFYPASGALAGSEHMLGLAVLTGPLRLFTSNAVAIYAITLVLTSFLLACNTFLLGRWLTGSPLLSLVAAAVTSFMPWRAAELAHLQLLGVAWFPLVWLLSMRILMGEASRRTALALGVVLTLQLLTSYYLAYMMTLSLVVLCGVAFWRRAAGSREALRFACACAAPYALLAAFSVPYLARSDRGEIASAYGMGMVVGSEDLARLWQTMAPRAHLFWRHADTPQTAYYVPLILLILAAATCLRGGAAAAGDPSRTDGSPGGDVADRQRNMLPVFWLTAGVAFTLMLGAEMRIGDTVVRPPGYWASLVVPGLSHFRAPHRWSILIGLIAPVLAAVGAQRAAARLAAASVAGRLVAALRVAAITAVAVALAISVPWRRVRAASVWEPDLRAPEAYAVLAGLPAGPVLELPWYEHPLARTLADSSYLVATTVHWHPILNGVTGYPPPSMLLLNAVAQGLPGPDELELLGRMTGLRWIVVHVAKAPALRARWEQNDLPLRLAFRGEQAWIFEVPEHSRSAAWIEALRSTATRDTTISGVPRSRLELEADAGSLQAELSGTATAELPVLVRLSVRNRSGVVWPGLDFQRDGTVELRYIYDRPDGTRAAAGLVPLFADVAPGEPVIVSRRIQTPSATGSYRLCLDLVQAFGEQVDPLPVPPVAIDVTVTNLRGSDPSRPTLAGAIAAAHTPPTWPSRCARTLP